MRRTLLFALLIAIAVVAAIAIWLVATTPRSAGGVSVPMRSAHRELLAQVPADAELFALVPAAAAVHAKLRSNPVTAAAVEQWSRERRLPPAWMLGGADLLAWRTAAGTTYAFRLDPLRAVLVRSYLLFGSADVSADGAMFFIGPAPAGPRLAASRPDLFLEVATGMSGDGIVVQLDDDPAFPPIGRPAVSFVAVTPREVTIVSRAARPQSVAAPQRTVTLPLGGLLSAWFAEPTRLVSDLDRLLPGDLSSLLAGGGSLILYDVDTGLLLPRPRGLFAAPETPQASAAAARLETVAELVGGVERRDGQILIALDRQSLPAYATESFAPLPFPSNRWAVRLDPARMLPVAERLGDHRGLRFAAPRLQRSARSLRGWIGELRAAERIEAAAVSLPGAEELRVRVTAK